MKKILLLFGFFVVATTGIYAQVGIGTTDPATSAQLEVYAKNKGVLIPRVELTATNQFAPIVGAQKTSLLVYNTKTNTSKGGYEAYPGYYYWYANRWNRVISKNDFSSKEIVKEILKGSDIVTYDVKSNTFVYYNSSGTTTTATVDIIKLINSNTTTKINTEKIKTGAHSTVLATVVSGTVTEVKWVPINSLAVSGEKLTVQDGLSITGDGDGLLLKSATLNITSIDISKLTVSNTGINNYKGKLLKVTEDGGKVEPLTVPAGTTSTSVVTIKDGIVSTTTIDDLTKVTASNGLTKTNSDIELGGDLTKATEINVKNYDFSIKGLKATTITKTTQVVVMDKTGNVLKTVSATDFKGSGDYVTDGTPQETGNKIKATDKDTSSVSEKMITVIVEVTTTTTSIRSSTVADATKLELLAKASAKTISEIRVFSKGAITTTKGLAKHVAFSAATLEGTKQDDLVIRPGISSGGLVGPVFPGVYYIVVKYF